MKQSKYSDARIMSILKQAEGGVPVAELCREHGMSSATFYKWRAKFGGMDASLFASPERERLQMEPQACLPYLSRAGTEHADQTAQAPAT